MTQSSNQSSGDSRRTFRVLRVVAGVALISLGLLYQVLTHYRNIPFRSFLVLSGAVLVFSGFAHRIPARFKPSRFAWFRRIYRQRLTMPREVMAYLGIMMVLASGSMLGHSNTLLLVFSLMAGPFILNGWIVYAMLKRLRVERAVPSRVGAGETFPVQVTLHNDRRFMSCRLVRVADTISNDQEELTGRLLFFRIPVGESRSAAYRVRLMQRGTYRLGPVVISSRFPFGLGERGRYFETHDQILVHPRIGELSPTWWTRVRGEDRLVEQQQIRSGVFDDEFRQIREFRAGDAVRRIHWRTSARVNDLMVRDFHQNREHDAVVLLDLWSGGRKDHRNRVELAASLVATICNELSRTMGDAHVGFFISGTENVAVFGKSSPELWNRVLDALAVCEGSSEADPQWLADSAAETRTEAARPILVTTRDEGANLPAGTANTNGGAGTLHNAFIVHATQEGLADVFRLDTNPLPEFEVAPAGGTP